MTVDMHQDNGHGWCQGCPVDPTHGGYTTRIEDCPVRELAANYEQALTAGREAAVRRAEHAEACITRALELHTNDPGSYVSWCAGCDYAHPCPTRRALLGEP